MTTDDQCERRIVAYSGSQIALWTTGSAAPRALASGDLAGLLGLVPFHLGATQLLDIRSERDSTEERSVPADVKGDPGEVGPPLSRRSVSGWLPSRWLSSAKSCMSAPSRCAWLRSLCWWDGARGDDGHGAPAREGARGTDSLTGLSNRRHLLDRLSAAIAQAESGGVQLALLLIDLDGFKQLTTRSAQRAKVLPQIGPRPRGLLRREDTLARLGGDEFAVALSPGDQASASVAALRLHRTLERSVEVGEITVHVDASVGIAVFPAMHATRSACCSALTSRCSRPSGCGPATRFTWQLAIAHPAAVAGRPAARRD